MLLDKVGDIVRSGRTVDILRRAAEHGRKFPGLRLRVIYRTDNRDELRGLAHILHVRHKPILDKIGEISPRNKNKEKYLKAAKRFLKRQKAEEP